MTRIGLQKSHDLNMATPLLTVDLSPASLAITSPREVRCVRLEQDKAAAVTLERSDRLAILPWTLVAEFDEARGSADGRCARQLSGPGNRRLDFWECLTHFETLEGV